MRLGDSVLGLLLAVFGAGIAAWAWTFPANPGQEIGPGLFPLILGAGLALCGGILCALGRRTEEGRRVRLEPWVFHPRLALKAAAVVGALIFYAVAVDALGFHVAVFLILVALFVVFEVRARWIAPIAGGVAIGLHLAFYSLLRVPLPWGWLEGIAW